MKRLFTLSLGFLFLNLPLFAQPGYVDNPYFIERDPSGLLLTPDGDQEYLRIASRMDKWEDENWVLADSTLYTYNEDNQIMETFGQTFNGFYWINKQLDTYSYQNNLPVSWIRQIWENNQWVNSSKSEYQYENGLRTLWIRSIWEDEAWKNEEQWINTYDSISNLLVGTIIQYWENDIWTNYRKISNYYVDGVLSGNFWESFNESTQTWEPYSKGTYEYDGNGNRVLLTYQDWDGSEWVNGFRYLYEYDANNNRTLDLLQRWEDDQYEDWRRYLYEYDENDNLILTTYQYAPWTSGELENRNQYHYYYSLVSSVNSPALSFRKVIITPNPGSGHFQVMLTLPDARPVSLQVLDLTGRKLHQLELEAFEGQNAIPLDLQHLPNGLYWVHIQGGNFREITQLVKKE